MDERYSNLVAIRKLTRSVAEVFRGMLRDYLSVVAPLLRPSALLGQYIQSSAKENTRNSERVFADLQKIYAAVAGAKPFGIIKELKPPLEMSGSTLELAPVNYVYGASANGDSKSVLVTAPLTWELTYAGFSSDRLKQIVAERHLDTDVVPFLLHHALIQVALANQPGVRNVLEALRFKVTTANHDELGGLPLLHIEAPVTTLRPPDEIIIESTEISGRDSFEEIVDLDSLEGLHDPVKERLLGLVETHLQVQKERASA